MTGGRWVALGFLLLGVGLVLFLLGPGSGSSLPVPLPETSRPVPPGSAPEGEVRALGGPAALEALVEVRKEADPAGELPLPAYFAGNRVPRKGAFRVVDPWGRPWPGRGRITFLEGPCRGLSLDVGPAARVGGLPLGWSLGLVRLPGWKPFLRIVRLRRGVTWPLSLPSGGAVRVEGKVFGPEGRPLAGALVKVDGLSCRTGEEGEFRLEGVAPGECLFFVSAPGCVSSLFPCLVAGGGGKPLVFVLERGATLRGRVLFPGPPVPGVKVRLFPGGLGNRLCRYVFGAGPWVEAGPQGGFEIDGVPLNTSLRVWAEGEGLAPDGPGVRVGPLRPGFRPPYALVRLRPLPSVSGRVLDPAGKPLAGARVVSLPAWGRRLPRRWIPGVSPGDLDRAVVPGAVLSAFSREGRSDASGRFRVAIAVPPGEPWVLECRVPGYVPIEKRGGGPGREVVFRMLPLEEEAGSSEAGRGAQVEGGRPGRPRLELIFREGGPRRVDLKFRMGGSPPSRPEPWPAPEPCPLELPSQGVYRVRILWRRRGEVDWREKVFRFLVRGRRKVRLPF